MTTQKDRRSGIALLLTLFMVVVIGMLVAGMIRLFPMSGASAGHTHDRQLCRTAADAGVAYAWSRLQEDPNWTGGSARAVTVSNSHLTVIEDEGNVLGFLTTPDGQKSQFLIRFNYQNGPASAGNDPDDGLPDPDAPADIIKTAYVSFNNLDQSAPMHIYRATAGGNWPLASGSPYLDYDVPPYTCSIIVEGRAGRGLRDTTTTSPDPPAGSPPLATLVREVNLGRANLVGVDSAVYAGSDINTTGVAPGGTVKLSSSDGSAPTARTMTTFNNGGRTVDGGTDGRVYYSNYDGATSSPNPAPNVTGLQTDYSPFTAQKPHWLTLTWSQVVKANPPGVPDSSGYHSAGLQAGTYVWAPDASNPGKYVLDYYDQTPTFTTVAGEQVAVPPTGPPTQVYGASASDVASSSDSNGNGVAVNHTSRTMTITGNVYVQPTASATGLYILNPTVATDNTRPHLTFSPSPTQNADAMLTVNGGSIYVQGDVRGTGAITAGANGLPAKGNIIIQGTAAVQATPGDTVALYADNNLTIQPIPTPVAAALTPSGGGSIEGEHTGDFYHRGHDRGLHLGEDRHGGHHPRSGDPSSTSGSGTTVTTSTFGTLTGADIDLTGVVYAGGTFSADSASNLFIQGVVATPPTGGAIDVIAQNAEFRFDRAYLANAVSLSGPTRLKMTLSHTY